jgi:hypothetical protein
VAGSLGREQHHGSRRRHSRDLEAMHGSQLHAFHAATDPGCWVLVDRGTAMRQPLRHPRRLGRRLAKRRPQPWVWPFCPRAERRHPACLSLEPTPLLSQTIYRCSVRPSGGEARRPILLSRPLGAVLFSSDHVPWTESHLERVTNAAQRNEVSARPGEARCLWHPVL